jgi:hypothetical protein
MSNYAEKKYSYDGDVNVVATEDEEYIMFPDICQDAERRFVRKLIFACCQQLM